MTPGAPSCVTAVEVKFPTDPKDEGGRRAALAEWLVHPKNPLSHRSIVNRVWQYHFGRAIAETPGDFGRNGTPPSNPELLDYLADEFMRQGESLKKLHRLIVTSAVYRQSSDADPKAEKIDADNRLLWRMNRTRLEAEEVRDSVLAVSGSLDLTMGGPGFELFGFNDDKSPVYDHLAVNKINDPANWGAGFLPAEYQGSMLRPNANPPIFDLYPPEKSFVTPEGDADSLSVLAKLNKAHADARPGDSRLEARITGYELAARLQLSAPEVLDLSKETAETKKLYGVDEKETEEFGHNCLITRRLLERGVRFVQLWSGADNGIPRRNWDSHENILKDHGEMGRSMDKPVAGLLKDLKQRGLLDDTIVMWTTEFGRMPCTEGGAGRDHNPFAFTSWLAGGGVKGGFTYGASDEWGWKAVDNPTPVYDVHATILYLLGIDHKKLIVHHNGIDRRLTDVYGHVIDDLMA